MTTYLVLISRFSVGDNIRMVVYNSRLFIFQNNYFSENISTNFMFLQMSYSRKKLEEEELRTWNFQERKMKEQKELSEVN